MNTLELEKLSEKYFEEIDNRSDYHAYFFDRNAKLLKSVVFSWCHAQGYDEQTSDLLSLYIYEMAQRELIV